MCIQRHDYQDLGFLPTNAQATRTRTCTNPLPAHNGRNCAGITCGLGCRVTLFCRDICGWVCVALVCVCACVRVCTMSWARVTGCLCVRCASITLIPGTKFPGRGDFSREGVEFLGLRTTSQSSRDRGTTLMPRLSVHDTCVSSAYVHAAHSRLNVALWHYHNSDKDKDAFRPSSRDSSHPACLALVQ